MATKKKGGGGSHTLLIEIEVKVKHDRRKTELTTGFLREAVLYWVQTGLTFRGVQVVAMNWQRDGGEPRRAPSSRESLEGARASLGRLLLLIPFSVRTVGAGE